MGRRALYLIGFVVLFPILTVNLLVAVIVLFPGILIGYLCGWSEDRKDDFLLSVGNIFLWSDNLLRRLVFGKEN